LSAEEVKQKLRSKVWKEPEKGGWHTREKGLRGKKGAKTNYDSKLINEFA